MVEDITSITIIEEEEVTRETTWEVVIRIIDKVEDIVKVVAVVVVDTIEIIKVDIKIEEEMVDIKIEEEMVVIKIEEEMVVINNNNNKDHLDLNLSLLSNK